MSERLILCAVQSAAAKQFVREHHRHHRPPVGMLFAVGAWRDGALRGVAVVGRPTPRAYQDGFSCEVTRLCVRGDEPLVEDRQGAVHAPAACSFLYNAAKRAAMALGYRRIGTYTLKSEPGTSLVAAKWTPIAEVKGRSWDTPSRPRVDQHPTEDKTFWAPWDLATLYTSARAA